MRDDLVYSKIGKSGLEDAWIAAMPWIEKALGAVNNYHQEMASIQEQLKKGWVTLWAIQDKKAQLTPICFLITHVIEVGGFRTLVIRWCGGRQIDEWIEDIAELERLAGLDNCHKIEIWGRPGWIRKMKRFGFQPEFYVVSKIIAKKVQ